MKSGLRSIARLISRIYLLVAATGLLLSCNQISQQPPNIIFILVDDMGWTDLGCYGSEFYETPNIDGLASDGIVFSNAYASASICSPSRAAILTGKYPPRLNITDWIPGQDPKNRPLLGPEDLDHLPLEETTLAEVLGNNGYRTMFCGKWHLGGDGFRPEDQGFDRSIGADRFGSPPGGYYVPYRNPHLPDGPEGEYLTDRLTDESIEFIGEDPSVPFFLFLSYYTVHTPIQPCKRHIDRFIRKREELPARDSVRLREEGDGITVLNQYSADYASMVHALDENIGRLVLELTERNILDNTVIIFTSDNGGLSTLASTRRNYAPTSVMPLRAGKGWLYEGGIRVPLIVKPADAGTDCIPTVCEAPVTGTDFFPTISELAGIPVSPVLVDGRSLVPFLEGTADPERKEIFWHYPHYHGSAWKPGSAIRYGKWKLIEFHETGSTELYDLYLDPGERSDLRALYPDTAEMLLKSLHRLQVETGAKFAIPNR